MVKPSAAGVEDQLARIFVSDQFRDSPRLQAFLRFIVLLTVEGKTDQIKESIIALEVFGRQTSFDGNSDSIVRSAAGRLRARLNEYYEKAGASEHIRIGIPKGTYVPEICECPSHNPRVESTADVHVAVRNRPGHLSRPQAAVAAAAVLVALSVVAFFFRPHTARPYVPRGEAYDYYARGQYALAHHGPALSLFRKAVEIDPKFVAAHVGVAQAYTQQAANDETPPETSLALAEQAVQNAIHLDTASADAHAALGYIYYCRWKWVEADRQFRIATELGPGNASSWRLWALVHFASGRFDLAEQTLKRAATVESGTLKSAAMLAQIYYYERQYAQAITAARRLLGVDRNSYLARWVVASSLAQLGRTTEALQEWQPMLNSAEYREAAARQWAFYEAQAGNTADLRSYVKNCGVQTESYCSPWILAQAYVLLDDRPNCLRYLGQSAARRDPDLISLRWEPSFDRLRHDPEYGQLVHELGF